MTELVDDGWIWPHGQTHVPDDVDAVRRYLRHRSDAMGATRSPEGGISRGDVVAVIEEGLLNRGLRVGGSADFNPGMIDFMHEMKRIAVCVQAGRARTNNDSLLATLACASAPGVDWAILALPHTYKSSGVVEGVRQQLRELTRASGVHLHLNGVATVGY